MRYASIKALTRICKSLDTKDYEELRQTSWSCLVVYQETEINANVLEALKVGQVNSKVKNVLIDKKYSHQGGGASSSSSNTLVTAFVKVNDETKNIYCQMAINLYNSVEIRDNEFSTHTNTHRDTSNVTKQTQHQQTEQLFTNRSRLPQHKSNLNKKQTSMSNNDEAKSIKFENVPYGAAINSAKMATTNSSTNNSNSNNKDKKRTTLKEEIIIHNQFKVHVPTYFNRKNFDLMRIVEDQVRELFLKEFILFLIFFKLQNFKSIAKKREKNSKGN